MNKNTFRQLTDKELLILKKLAEGNFVGKTQLIEQIKDVTATETDKEGSLRLKVSSSSEIPIKNGVLVEAWCPNEDEKEPESQTHVLLHVKNAKIHLLEFYSDVGDVMKDTLDPDSFTLFSQYENKETNADGG